MRTRALHLGLPPLPPAVVTPERWDAAEDALSAAAVRATDAGRFPLAVAACRALADLGHGADDAYDAVVDSGSAYTGSVLTEVGVSGAGITRVVLTSTSTVWVFDDLCFTH